MENLSQIIVGNFQDSFAKTEEELRDSKGESEEFSLKLAEKEKQLQELRQELQLYPNPNIESSIEQQSMIRDMKYAIQTISVSIQTFLSCPVRF